MGNLNSQPKVIVVHKGPRKNSKIILEIFDNVEKEYNKLLDRKR